MHPVFKHRENVRKPSFRKLTIEIPRKTPSGQCLVMHLVFAAKCRQKSARQYYIMKLIIIHISVANYNYRNILTPNVMQPLTCYFYTSHWALSNEILFNLLYVNFAYTLMIFVRTNPCISFKVGTSKMAGGCLLQQNVTVTCHLH